MMLYPFKLLTILYYYNIVIEVEIVEFLKQNAWKGIFNLKQNCMMSYVFFSHGGFILTVLDRVKM